MHPLRPIIVLQWLATGIEPLHIAITLLPPAIRGQRRYALAQTNQCGGESDQSLLIRLPVKPAEGVVLTLSIIIAALRVATLIARQQHRRAL